MTSWCARCGVHEIPYDRGPNCAVCDDDRRAAATARANIGKPQESA